MQSISNKQFKAALKTLSRTKKGKGTREQRDALSVVVGYMGQFPPSNKTFGHFFIQVTDAGEYCSSLTGFPDAIAEIIAYKAMSDYDMNNLLERVIDKIKATHAEFWAQENPVVVEFTKDGETRQVIKGKNAKLESVIKKLGIE